MTETPRTISCLVVDDEPLAIALLQDYIGKVSFLQLAESTSDPIRALDIARGGSVDLVFFDMQMPELSGLPFMKILQRRCHVIITTAYTEFALDGYEHQVIDYLLKPITLERFMIAAEKARDQIDRKPSMPAKAPPTAPGAQHIFVKTEHRIVKIDLPDIYYLEGARDYVIIHTGNEKILTLQPMRELEQLLPASQFIRIHKSYIVSIPRIQFIERSRVSIKGQLLPISDTFKASVLAAIHA